MSTFCDYMEQALYGPTGYYSSGTAKSGKAGDYFTAPDVGPVFGQLLAEIFGGWKDKLGKDDFCLIEAGAGEGRLARDILACHPFRYVAVERSPVRRSYLERVRGEYPELLEVHADLKKREGLSGVLFANELIDAFPVHRVQFKGGRLRELFVEGAGERRRFNWKESSNPRLPAYFGRLGISLPDGYETEVNLAMADWVREAAGVLGKGLLVVIDYGRPGHEYYAPERVRGTLRAFSKHKVSADFLDPGRMVDLTADVDFTSLALDAQAAGFVPLAFMELGTFLLQGIELLQKRAGERESGRASDGALIPPTPSLPRSLALRYLIHPEGLGSAFHVLVLGKGIDPADWKFEHNRLPRLGL
jgi:SAM-dependent MidA family methyltransferase